MRFLDCGDGAVLVELTDLEQVMALHRTLTGERPGGILEVVPAARTLLVQFDPEIVSAQQVRDWVDRVEHHPAAGPRPAAVLEIPVAYDGPDLAEVAAATSLPVAEFIRRHTAPTYRVAFCGFAPGFGYLTGLPPELRLPRRPDPRTKVPAGAVAIADEFTGVYPRESPGGWHLLGHTELPTFEINRNPPALLTPGTTVRFVAVAD